MGSNVSCSTTGVTKSGHVRILPLTTICPSPENDKLYKPVIPADPAVVNLAASIRDRGLLEPLVVTSDRYILSGHRRFVAARLAGLKELACRVSAIPRLDSSGKVNQEFLRLLAEYNLQREKSLDEKLRESVVKADPDDAHRTLSEYRRARARSDALNAIVIAGVKHRAKISKAKRPFADAVVELMQLMREYWPLSDRYVHYGLLNDPPLRHAAKPDSTYANDSKSYKDLTDLLTRMRLAGDLPMKSIADETRPVSILECHLTVAGFIGGQLQNMFGGYYRDLMQSQPNHIEIVAEKRTVRSIIEPVALDYCIPMTIGRGYCSLAPRADIATRFHKSGKEQLILLVVSDFDPDGAEIAHSLARSLRDDFKIGQVRCVKVALTADQVRQRGLPPRMKAKKTSAHWKKFTVKHGEDVFELEALPPADLKRIVEEAVQGAINSEAFDHEIAVERNEATFLDEQCQKVLAALGG